MRLERSPGPQKRDQGFPIQDNRNRLPVGDVGGRRSTVEKTPALALGFQKGNGVARGSAA